MRELFQGKRKWSLENQKLDMKNHIKATKLKEIYKKETPEKALRVLTNKILSFTRTDYPTFKDRTEDLVEFLFWRNW